MKSFLTATQIARLEEVTPTTVARWVREGRFEDVRKVGRVYRVPMESYRRWRETTKLTVERSFERTNERTNERSDLSITKPIMGKVLSISIFKGGAGKTASSVSLASALGQLGARVLLIDLDQQASATRHVGLDPETETPNLYHVFKKQVTARTAVKTLDHGFSVIPGNSLLAAIEEALEEGDETMLRELIAGLRDEFDYLILDSPPGKAMLSFNALSAADEVIIPLPAERPALDGVQDLLRFIHEVVWEKYNPGLKIRGILPTMYKKTTTHSAGVVDKAREIWGDKVFPVEVPETIAFPRAYAAGQPLPVFDPGHEGTLAYLAVARLIHGVPADLAAVPPPSEPAGVDIPQQSV